MARTLAQYLFAALLALLPAPVHVARPFSPAVAIEIVCRRETRQQIACEIEHPQPPAPAVQTEAAYRSRTVLEFHTADLFQRPPPAFGSFA